MAGTKNFKFKNNQRANFQIFAYIVIVLFVIDGFLRYRAFKAGTSAATPTTPAGLDPSNATQAAAPKY